MDTTGAFGVNLAAVTIWAMGAIAGGYLVDRYPPRLALIISLFPVELRYTAAGLAHNLSITLFGSTGPYVSTWLVDRTGNPIAPAGTSLSSSSSA